MMPEPTVLPEWAMQDVLNDVSGQYNVVEPPSEKKLEGWAFGEKPNRQWWNWFQRQCALWIAYFRQQEAMNVVTDENGIGLFPIDGALIQLNAVDLDDPTKYFNATGIKVAGQPPQFAATGSSGLALGVGTITGNQPITGGTNVIINGITRVIPV